MPGVLAAYVGSRTGGTVLYLAWRLSSLLSSLGSSLVLACWGCVPCTLEGILFIPNVGGRTPLIFLTRQKVYLVVDTTFSTLACYRLVPWDCFRTLGMVGMVHPASSEPFLAFNSSLVDLALLR